MHSAFNGVLDHRALSGQTCSTSYRPRLAVRCSANKGNQGKGTNKASSKQFGLGDLLGPIGLTLGAKLQKVCTFVHHGLALAWKLESGPACTLPSGC